MIAPQVPKVLHQNKGAVEFAGVHFLVFTHSPAGRVRELRYPRLPALRQIRQLQRHVPRPLGALPRSRKDFTGSREGFGPHRHEALELFICAVKDWSLGAYDEAWQLFRQFTLCTPQDRLRLDLGIQTAGLALSRGDQRLSRRERDGAGCELAGGPPTRAATGAETRAHSSVWRAEFPAQLKKIAEDLQQKITAEQEEAARRMSATEAADAKALADAEAKIAPLWQQFRLADAVAIAQGPSR